MALINYGTKGARLLGRIWDLLVLNIYWIITSLPLVTIGAATVAAHQVSRKILDDEDVSLTRIFFSAWVQNLRQGILLTLIGAGFSASLFLYLMLFENMEGNPIIFSMLAILIAAVFLAHFFYVFALVARYENSLLTHLANSRRIFIRFFPGTLMCLLMLCFELWLFFFNGPLLMYMAVFIGPIIIITTMSSFSRKIFMQLESEQKDITHGDNN